jgi:hypothetical protein
MAQTEPLPDISKSRSTSMLKPFTCALIALTISNYAAFTLLLNHSDSATL